jgi:hypothetical protein
MKIIFEQSDLDSFEKDDLVKRHFPKFRRTNQEIGESLFQIMIDDFPAWLREGICISSEIFFDGDNIAPYCNVISGKISPSEYQGLFHVECERVERHEGEIIQRVWIAFMG